MTFNISTKIQQKVFSFFYIFDCITYTIMLFSVFLFISLLTSNVAQDITFFDLLIFLVTLFQISRPFIMVLFKNMSGFIREASLAFLFGSIYFFFYQVNNIDPDSNIPLIFKIRTTIEIFFYSIYLLFTFGRVSTFLRSIRMDFLYSFTFGFIFLIFFGTWLLSLPFARTHDIPILDLLFTATSAVTVTGLSTIDISTDLTFIGQLILMLLVQVGGLGILTFSTLYIINLKDRLSLEERNYTTELYNAKEMTDINKLLKGVILSTILIELLGAIILYIGSFELNINPEHRLFFSIFHAINGFCNAGFSIISSNLRYFYDNPIIIYTMSTLIVLGGLGFVTLLDIKKKLGYWFTRKSKRERVINLSRQTKLILIITFLLIVGGAIIFFYAERYNTLAGFTTSEKISNSFFQSITTRTAGFQSISMVNLKESTLWTMAILMFIGTAPNGTGGGIKLTTLFVLIWALGKVFLHRTQSQEPLMGFNFTTRLVAKAGFILFLRILILSIGILLMSFYDNKPIFAMMFEAVSAFSTVGLTLNLTSLYSSGSKVVLILLMFIGRVGSFYILSNIVPIKEKKSVINRKKDMISLE